MLLYSKQGEGKMFYLPLPFSCLKSFGFPGWSWTTQGCSRVLKGGGGWTSAGKYGRVGRRGSNSRGETANSHTHRLQGASKLSECPQYWWTLATVEERGERRHWWTVPAFSSACPHLVTLKIFIKNAHALFTHLVREPSVHPLDARKCPVTCQWRSTWRGL